MAILRFPFEPDARGRSRNADDAEHVRDMIEQVLFTVPGERVNRPDFGCGLLQLVFAPNSDTLAAAVPPAPVLAALKRELALWWARLRVLGSGLRFVRYVAMKPA